MDLRKENDNEIQTYQLVLNAVIEEDTTGMSHKAITVKEQLDMVKQ